ncbi:MAG: 50S ribosomal protein L17 [Marinilabiliales bacterium]|nr:MAG: 50S ribosomal protein L17 [Marinilabiliales bacterium]
MRHKKGFNHLSRKAAHRNAMLSNMAASLIIHKRISTTLAKAKALRSYVEPLITRSKDNSMHNRRVVFSYLQNKEAVNELFREVADKIANRPGGYTRILKTGVRPGDDAQMCIIELVDYNDNLLTAKEEKAGSKRTRRGRTGKKTTDTPKAEVKEESIAEEVKEEITTEEPKEEVKEEVKAEVKEEEPKEEEVPAEEKVEEEAPIEEAKEEPIEEVKEEAPEEEKKEEEKEDAEEKSPEEGDAEKNDEEEPSK